VPSVNGKLLALVNENWFVKGKLPPEDFSSSVVKDDFNVGFNVCDAKLFEGVKFFLHRS